MFALREIMTPWPVFLPMDTSLSEAARSIASNGTGVMPVCSPDRALQGLVGDRELSRLVARGNDPYLTTVGELVVNMDAPSIEVDDPIEVALFAMQVHAARHLPVVEDGILVGMVSFADLMKSIPEPRKVSATESTELVA